MSLVRLKRVLSEAALAELLSAMAKGKFSATGANGPLELDAGPAYTTASGLLTAALQAHPQFDAAAHPCALQSPTFYRFEAGTAPESMHAPALVGTSPTMRVDMAVLIPLGSSENDEGGEWLLDPDGVPTTWRGEAGDGLLHPASTAARFTPLTQGSCTVAIVLAQSRVSDSAQRRILFDMAKVLEQFAESGLTNEHVETVRRSYFNLLRRWT